MSDDKAPDQIDAAIEASSSSTIPGVLIEFTINAKGPDGLPTHKPASITLPADLTEPEAFAFLGAAADISRQIVADAEARKGPKLEIVRGNLPPAPGRNGRH